jgi:hypothetical protein
MASHRDRYRDILARILTGLLGENSDSPAAAGITVRRDIT